MVTFPPNMTATKYSGYFWDVFEQQLYSLKPSGELRKMLCRWNYFMDGKYSSNGVQGYQISVNSVSKFYTLNELRKLKLKDSIVPYKR